VGEVVVTIGGERLDGLTYPEAVQVVAHVVGGSWSVLSLEVKERNRCARYSLAPRWTLQRSGHLIVAMAMVEAETHYPTPNMQHQTPSTNAQRPAPST
jgi:hypothetical protein